MDNSKGPKAATKAVWSGEQDEMWKHSTQVPIVQSVSFGYDDMDEWLAVG